MAKIREKDRNSVMNAVAGGVTPRQGIQHIQVGRLDETAAILLDLEQVKQGGGAVRVIQASYGSGKRLPLEALVLGKDGWVRNGDLSVGDEIFNRNGKLTTVKYISEQTEEDVYELVLSDGRVMECCGDHQWIVTFLSRVNHVPMRKEKIMTAKEMLEKGIRQGPDGKGGSWRFHLPLCQPIEFPERELPIDPYVLGAFLGDGCCTEPGLSLSSATDYIPNKISSIINPQGYTRKSRQNYTWHFYVGENNVAMSSKINEYYKSDGKRFHVRKNSIIPTKWFFRDMPEVMTTANAKHIPPEYLCASIEQRRALLQGLMDTDGSPNNGRVSFSTNSKQLATDVQQLVRSLGYASSTRYDYRPEKYTNEEGMQYIITIWSKDEDIFSLPEKRQVLVNYVKQRRSNKRIRNSVDVPIVEIRHTDRKAVMQCIAVADDTHSYITNDFTVTHNTFFLTLSKTVALKQNMLVMTADLSPDRRLYASDGKAQNLYRELVRSLSSPMKPDGGALEELLDAVDEKVMSGDSDFLADIRKLPYGFDAVTVCNRWHIAKNPISDKEKRDAFIMQDATLRWFSGEASSEHKKLLGTRSLIGDDGAWDALKLVAMMAHYAGYSGLLVEFDECVNLYKINNSTSRDRNYEQILRIFNECLQGDAKYVGVIFSGTPEFVMDPRRGLFSYDALKSRLVASEYADKSSGVDTSGPVIDLKPLSQEDLLVLLGNLTNVEALGNREDWLLENEHMVAFLKKQYDTLGADYYRTPRELLRSFVMLLRILRENPDLSPDDVISTYEVKEDKRQSGLGQALDNAQPNNSVISASVAEEEDFGF